MAPVWQVNPKPMSTEATMKTPIPSCSSAASTYKTVAIANAPIPSRNDALRPMVSATTPVGTSKTSWPTVNVAFTTMTVKMSSPAPRRKRVFTAQISDAASVNSPFAVR